MELVLKETKVILKWHNFLLIKLSAQSNSNRGLETVYTGRTRLITLAEKTPDSW